MILFTVQVKKNTMLPFNLGSSCNRVVHNLYYYTAHTQDSRFKGDSVLCRNFLTTQEKGARLYKKNCSVQCTFTFTAIKPGQVLINKVGL